MELILPHKFNPRSYQEEVFQAREAGVSRFVEVWHRRSGKDKTFVNFTARESALRVGSYFYCFPSYAQGKKAIWEGRDKDGTAFLDHFPSSYVKHRDDSELKLTFINGSIFRVIGVDNINSLMSTNPIGVVFSEYSLQDPSAWNLIRPILRENKGWAAFIYTPRGKNHGWDMYQLGLKMQLEENKDWHCRKLDIHDTGALSDQDVEDERNSGMEEELIQQEYFCSFTGVQLGSYYGKQMELAEAEGRICKVPYTEGIPVDTWWDLGINDAMAIWFTQTVGRAIHVIDYYENSGEGLPHYAKYLRQKDYIYGTHNAPHDIKVRELGSGKSRLETAASLGINFHIVPNIDLLDGIDAARSFLNRCYFDFEKTSLGRNALISYRKNFNEKRKCFESKPYHDWSSNGSDAFRYLAVGHKISNPRIKSTRSSSNLILPASRSNSVSQNWMGC